MGQNFQWQNYIFLIVFFAFSAGSWIFGTLRQQAIRKRARVDARNRFEEQLRTGRSEEAPKDPTAAPVSQAQKLAARRQAQLQRLREQQAGAPVQTTPLRSTPKVPRVGQPLVRVPQQPQARPTGRPPTGVVIQRAPSGTPLPPRRSAAQAPSRQPRAAATSPKRSPAQQSLRAPAPTKLMQEEDPREVRRMRREFEKQQSGRTKRKDQSKRIKKTPEPAPAQSARQPSLHSSVRSLLLPGGKRKSASQLRSLIAVSELLGKPMGVREEHELPWMRR